MSKGVELKFEGHWDDGQLTSLLSMFDKMMRVATYNAAVEVLVPALREVLGEQGPPRSDPGKPPHRQTEDQHAPIRAKYGWEHLQDEVRAMLTDDGVEIGADNIYGLYLEIGTREMAARPWLLSTLDRSDVRVEFQAAIQEELTAMMEQL